MIQSVFCAGELIAFHANVRVREGVGGGASHKLSIDLPAVREQITHLGGALGWHGALSVDAILAEDGPVYIDINPRLVEPGNAWRAGVDLVAALLDVGAGKTPAPQAPGAAGVATHQLLLAVLGAAQHAGTRRAVLAELTSAARHAGSYRRSAEELTPLRGDLRAVFPLAAASLATVVRPATWRAFSSGAVTSYALSPQGWRAIVDDAAS